MRYNEKQVNIPDEVHKNLCWLAQNSGRTIKGQLAFLVNEALTRAKNAKELEQKARIYEGQ